MYPCGVSTDDSAPRPPNRGGAPRRREPPRPTRRADRNAAARRALADTLRTLRERVEPRLSQEELAYLAQLDRGYVGQLERARRWPTLESCWYILRALGVSWSEFGAALDAHAALRADPDPRREG